MNSKLIGAVLVGLSFAKSVAFGLGVPLIPVHHIRGHIAANYLAFPDLEPPFLALCMSGGNTLLVDVASYTDFRLVGATRDDAAGECFDKTGYSEMSLSCLSVSDYTRLPELIDKLLSWTDEKKVSLSLPSQRIDAFYEELMEKKGKFYELKCLNDLNLKNAEDGLN